jgi:hypothetical protein
MQTAASRTRQPRVTSLTYPKPKSFSDLFGIAIDAARIRPPLYLKSLLGPMRDWVAPRRHYSEFGILSPSKPIRSARYLRDVSIPARPWSPPAWAEAVMPDPVTELFWRPSRFFRQSDEYGSPCAFPHEHWFFINGVATNEDVARLNAAFLVQLFHRPITVIQNATDSLLFDLLECAVGKGFKKNPDNKDRKTMTEPAWKATAAILEALNAPATKRVVVIAHSQGTIIMSNVLRAIARALREQRLLSTGRPDAGWHAYTDKMMGGVETDADKALRDDLAHSLSVFGSGKPATVLARLKKLEIYTFANCADRMNYVVKRGDRQYPHMEHFANEFDVVARLGILSPNSKIDIDGPAYVKQGGWGHFLNEHHLFAIDDYLYPGRDGAGVNPYQPRNPADSRPPRLYGYFHGKRPARPGRAAGSTSPPSKAN